MSSSSRILIHIHKVDSDHAVVIEVVVVVIVVSVIVVAKMNHFENFGLTRKYLCALCSLIVVVGSVDDVNDELGGQDGARHHPKHPEVCSAASRPTKSISSSSFNMIHDIMLV